MKTWKDEFIRLCSAETDVSESLLVTSAQFGDVEKVDRYPESKYELDIEKVMLHIEKLLEEERKNK